MQPVTTHEASEALCRRASIPLSEPPLPDSMIIIARDTQGEATVAAFAHK